MIYENIASLCRKRNISISKLEQETGLGNATIRSWRTSSPSVDKLKRVADFLEVTIDCLISDPDNSTLNEKVKVMQITLHQFFNAS